MADNTAVGETLPSSTSAGGEESAAPASTGGAARARYNHIASSGVQDGSSGSSTSRGTPDFLVLVLDCNPFGWADAADSTGSGHGGALELDRALKDTLIFLNAHMALQHDNGVAVYAAAGRQATLLFSTASHSSLERQEAASEEETKPDANTFQHFKTLDSRVYSGVRRVLEDAAEQMENELDGMDVDGDATSNRSNGNLNTTGIVSAISQSLCHINRLNLSSLGASDSAASSIARSVAASGNAESAASTAVRGFRSRILVLSVTPDASTQYVAMMNCIFGAQKSMLPINVCKLHGEDSVFLQQAAHLTGGNYLRVDNRKGLLQILMSAFLPSRSISMLINVPNQDEVDFRAACFCHRKIVDVGYVCSVCLSIFCAPMASCSTCKSRFPKKSLQRFTAEHKLLQILGVSD